MWQNKIMENEKKYPEGHFKSRWMILGILIASGIGIPISIYFNNMSYIGIGSIIGVLIGKLIGDSIEKKHQDAGNIRELNEDEIKNKKRQFLLLLFIGAIGFIVLMYYQSK